MGLVRAFWERVAGSKVPMDLAGLPFLGVVAYLLFRHAAVFKPLEGALLIMVTAGLLRAGLSWWDWHRGLANHGSLMDGVQRILQGERRQIVVPEGLLGRDRRVAAALNVVLGDLQRGQADLTDLRQAMAREWKELDGLLGAVQNHHVAEEGNRIQGRAQLASLGRDLKLAIEKALRLDQVELHHRLRADQFRLQAQTFSGTLEQLRAGIDHFENLLEELQDTFPRLRREEDALGRLADAGLRQGARLGLSVKGLVSHTPRLVDGTQTRMEWLGRLRRSTDDVRDQTEALARRIEGFREEAQLRIRSFGGAQGSMKELDHVAQQTGLLAVNAAILAQQGGGSTGMAAIGGRLRVLADQTAEGAAGMQRTLDDYQRGLERETAGLWDIQEVTQRLLSGVHELLRTAGQLDHQGHDLEGALETHLGLVDQVRQASERAELSLHEVGERAMALESAHGRQWGVEAKISPERERLSRLGARLAEIKTELDHLSLQNIDVIWDVLARNQEIQRTDAYRLVTSEGLPQLMDGLERADSAWNGITWARAQRRFRLVEGARGAPPTGRRSAEGELRLLLLGQDALHSPEASALESWSCDGTGQAWDLHLLPSLRTENHRLELLALLKESPLSTCFQGVDMRIAPEGVHINLPHPYPGLPGFLAGLRLELPVEPELWDHAFREAGPRHLETQCLIWLGPEMDGGLQHEVLRHVHAWVRDDPRHESFLPWLPYDGHRPPCPWQEDHEVADHSSELSAVRCLGLGTDAAALHPYRDRLLQAGATEGSGGMTLCAIHISHPHPEALLLRLFQSDIDLAGTAHADLLPYQTRLRDEVLGNATGDSYRAAWTMLEEFQRMGWVMPLPPG